MVHSLVSVFFHHPKGCRDIIDPLLYQPQLLLFSCSVGSDSLWPHGLQNARLPCPSLSPGVCSDSRPLSRWCHPTISSSVVPFSCPQSSPESGSFPISRFFTSGGQSIGASASAQLEQGTLLTLFYCKNNTSTLICFFKKKLYCIPNSNFQFNFIKSRES